jgi:para-nitrobenzyl esterase
MSKNRTAHSARLIAGFCLAFAACSTLAQPSAADPTLARTRQGLVRGATENGNVVFKGMPYAAPPVGSRRWKPPLPPAAWEGERDATKFGPPCPSIDGTKLAQGRWLEGGGATIFVDVPTAPGSSEDCLRLNVWAPANASRAAVLVWLQPTGPASFPFFNGAAFARDGVLFVSLDYRQLTLGNFAHPKLTAEAAPGEPLARFQTMDQMAALAWVRENIAAFGGDPDNVTVYGQSAGGWSVLQLLTIPAAKGLIDKAIVQSGAGWSRPFSLAQMERVGSAFATHAGLPGADATAEQLRALPPGALPEIGVYSIDGRFQLENATTAIDAGRMLDVPLLIGWTDFDGSSLREGSPDDVVARAPAELLAAYAADGKTGADLGYQLYTDEHVGAPARWIAGKASAGAPSYLYLFSYVRSGNRGRARGAAHGDDIPLAFDIWSALPQIPISDEDRAATRLVHSCWVSFAKIGKPTCEGAPDWPRYTPESDQLMELGSSPAVRERFRERQLDAQEEAWRVSGGARTADDVEAAVRRFEEGGLRAPN